MRRGLVALGAGFGMAVLAAFAFDRLVRAFDSRDEAGGSRLQLLPDVVVLTVVGLGVLRALRGLWSRIDAEDGRSPEGSPVPGGAPVGTIRGGCTSGAPAPFRHPLAESTMDEVPIPAPGANEGSRTAVLPRHAMLPGRGTPRPGATERAGVR